MAEAFDPYHIWLAIPPEDQPPHHYRLLGLTPFEANPDVIESAADQRMSHVRSFQGGKHSAESQKLLNELAAARLCVLSPEKRQAYDRALKAKLAAEKPAPPPAPSAPATPASAPRPLVKARPLAAQPLAAPAEPAAPLGFDPLAGSAAPRHRKTKRNNQQPALLAGVGGAALLAVVGLVWALAGGDGDQSGQQSARQTASTDHGPKAQDHDDTAKGTKNRTPGPKDVDRPTADEPRPEQVAADDPADDSTSDVGAVGDRANSSDDVMDSVMPEETNDAEPEATEPSESTLDEATPPREPVPDAEALKGAVAEIQSLLKADFSAAKKPDQKIALAEKLIGLAKDSEAPAERYALLSEAERLATSAGAFGLAMQAIDAIAEEFETERLALAAEMVDAAGDKELPAAARKELVEIVLPLVDEAVAAGQFKLARRLATTGLAAARKASATDAAKSLARQAHDMATQEKQAEAADTARKTLEDKPDDAAAHLALGRYLCLVLGHWDEGLPHLKQGSDAALRSAADAELAGAESSADQVKLGDLWWDLADDHKGSEKERLRARSGYWYSQAIGEVTGLSKAKVEKRLADLPASIATPEPRAPKPTQFLSELKPEEVHLWAGFPLNGKVVVADVPSPHGLFMHPFAGGFAHVAYELPRGYRMLDGKAGMNDTVVNQSDSGLTFRIVGDGREIWKSRMLGKRSESQDFRVSIDGIKKLELFVDCPTNHGMSHAVWIEPRLTSRAGGSALPSKPSNRIAVGKWVDLLPLVDPQKQTLRGKWTITPDGLRGDGNASESQIQIPVTIAGSYEIEASFTRLAGGEGLGFIIPAGETQTMLGLSVDAGSLSGIFDIDGRPAQSNESGFRPGTVENGKRHLIKIRVQPRGDEVAVDSTFDGHPYVHWHGLARRLTTTKNWKPPQIHQPALGVWDSVVFHNLRFKLLSGTATIDGIAGPGKPATRSVLENSKPREGTMGGLLKGAVLIATFDEPTIIRKNGEVRVRDVSGKQKPGLVVGAEFVPGKTGRALSFRQVGDRVDFGTDSSLNPASFTLCAWIMPAPHDNPWTDIFSKHSNGQGHAGLVVRIDANRPEFGIGIGDGQWHFLRPGMPIPLEQWSHFAATHDTNTSSIYINGQLARSAPSDGPVIASQDPCYIGMTREHDELQFYGLIDEPALFDRAMSADEVQQIYQLGVKGKSLTSANK
jgi:hypothetical protein